MTDTPALVQDLLAHAPEAPDHCARLMRDAARVLDRYKHLVGIAHLGDAEPSPPPFPPPDLGGKHRRPPEAAR